MMVSRIQGVEIFRKIGQSLYLHGKIGDCNSTSPWLSIPLDADQDHILDSVKRKQSHSGAHSGTAHRQ